MSVKNRVIRDAVAPRCPHAAASADVEDKEEYVTRSFSYYRFVTTLPWLVASYYVCMAVVFPESESAKSVMLLAERYGYKWTVVLRYETCVLGAVLALVYGFAQSAGYHRYFCHSSFESSFLMRLFFLLVGAGTLNGSVLSYAENHRTWHAMVKLEASSKKTHSSIWWFTTSLFSYFLNLNNSKGTFVANTNDLSLQKDVVYQDILYSVVAYAFGLLAPAVIASAWGDFYGGLLVAGFLRAVIFIFVNSILTSASFLLGSRKYNSKMPVKDFVFPIFSLGESTLNFHYQFPSDYRMGSYFDVTRSVLKFLSLFGLVRKLSKVPDHCIKSTAVNNELETLEEKKKEIVFGPEPSALPCMTKEEMKLSIEKEGKKLFIMDNMVFDLTAFIANHEHPGGDDILMEKLGKDITISFNGGVQRHSKAARNLAAMFRVARLQS
eukprot:Nk52_evm120s221 gene=Nk52_evmTU120s221